MKTANELFTISRQLHHTFMIYCPIFQLGFHFSDKMVVWVLVRFCDKSLVKAVKHHEVQVKFDIGAGEVNCQGYHDHKRQTFAKG